MAALSKMTRAVVVNALGCADPVAEEYLLHSAIELCRRAYAWTEEVQETLQVSDFPFDVTPPSGAKMLKVLSIAESGKVPPFEETSLRDCNLSVPNWKTATGTPAKFIEAPRGTVAIVPLPLNPTLFDITAAYVPSDTATSIPDALYDEHRDTIISGAIMRLCMIPKAEWFNPEIASVHKRLFEDGVATASRMFHLHHVLAPLAVAISPL